MIKIKKAIVFILSLLLTLSVSIPAFAMDTDYVNDPFKWIDNDNITYSKLNTPNGFYEYFFNENDSTFYFHISYSISGLNNNSNIKLAFSSTNTLNSYSVTFCKNEIEDSTSNSKNALSLLSSFSGIKQSGQDIYFAAQFLNKEDKKLRNDISVDLRIDRTVYKICSNLSFISNTDISTTKKEKTTSKKDSNNKNSGTKVPNDNQNANNQTKFHYNSDNKDDYNNNQNNNYSNTKYNYNNDDEYYENSNIIDDINSGKIIIPEEDSKFTFSPISKILLSTSTIFCIAGIGLIIHSLIKSKQNNKSIKEEKNHE